MHSVTGGDYVGLHAQYVRWDKTFTRTSGDFVATFYTTCNTLNITKLLHFATRRVCVVRIIIIRKDSSFRI